MPFMTLSQPSIVEHAGAPILTRAEMDVLLGLTAIRENEERLEELARSRPVPG